MLAEHRGAVALRRLQIRGALVSISAGWQEREGEIDELLAHVRLPVTDLALYARAEAVLAADAELAVAYRQRQGRLRELQDLYRLRLTHAKDAMRELMANEGDAELVRAGQRGALRALRALDREHLLTIEREHAGFRRRLRPQQRASVVPHIRELRELIEPAAAVLVAGGHVAVLLNRLMMFDVLGLTGDRPIIGWSAGAMVLTERVVLFHDHPPYGPPIAEVLDTALGLARGIVALPEPRLRLRLDDLDRVAGLARRFAPAACVAMDHGARVTVAHAEDWTLETFRNTARVNLGARGDFVLVNYLRARLDQEGSGHISPLAAYDVASDQLLILDTASYKYHPAWVRTADLWAAMDTIDEQAGLTRGFLTVAGPAPAS